MNVLTVNLLFSTFVFWVAARIYVLPKLADLKPRVLTERTQAVVTWERMKARAIDAADCLI